MAPTEKAKISAGIFQIEDTFGVHSKRQHDRSILNPTRLSREAKPTGSLIIPSHPILSTQLTMNELITAALEQSPIPEMDEQKASSPSEVVTVVSEVERIETETDTDTDNNYEKESPPPPEPSSQSQQSQGSSPRSYDNDDDADDDTREARTPPQASGGERRAYRDPTEQEQEQRYRSSPPPPPSLSSSTYHPHYQHQQHPHSHPHQQQQQQQFQQQYAHPHPHHQGENAGFYDYHLTPPALPPPPAPLRPPVITQQQRSNWDRWDRYRRNVHPSKVLPSATDSFRSGGCTCKKSRYVIPVYYIYSYF
jgi:hypothetical protein